MILYISLVYATCKNTIYNMYLCKLCIVEVCIMRYYNDNDDNDKFILMRFIGFDDAVYCLSSKEHDADRNDVSNATKDHR